MVAHSVSADFYKSTWAKHLHHVLFGVDLYIVIEVTAHADDAHPLPITALSHAPLKPVPGPIRNEDQGGFFR